MDEKSYNKGLMVFSDDGEVQDVKMAKEGVKSALPSIAVTCDDGIVLASCTKNDDYSLLNEDKSSSVFTISDRVGMVASGRVADAQSLADEMRDKAAEDIELYGSVQDVNVIANHISKDVRETTQSIVSRPYGVSLMVGGINGDDTISLFKIDVDGSLSTWDACAVGKKSDKMLEHMESRYGEVDGIEDCMELALTTILMFSDATPSSLSVHEISKDEYRIVDEDEINETVTGVIEDE